MQRLEVSGAVRLIYGSLGVKRLRRPANNSRREQERSRIAVAVYALDFTHRSVLK